MQALLVLFLTERALAFALRLLNLRYLRLHGARVPVELSGEVAPDTLQRMAAYASDRARVGLVMLSAATVLTALALFAGGLGWYDRLITAHVSSFVAGAVTFVLGLVVIGTVVGLPVDWYMHFRLEERHGFNRMTLRLWLSDALKSLLLSLVITGTCTAVAAWLLSTAPRFWWFYVWLFLSALSVLLMYLAPVLIEPLFFKMKPLEVEGLTDSVRELALRTGVKVKRVLEVDASRRSSHSNAYFTGIGRVKRVVLFDTLLERMTHSEILAVLAHELGHWKKHHILQRLLLSLLGSLVGLYLASRLLVWSELPALVGLAQASLYARALIVGFVASLCGFLLTPFSSYWSRRHERQADVFAAELTNNPQALASALLKLSRDNLANLHPHPLFAAFYYSHPPAVERVRKLRDSAAH